MLRLEDEEPQLVGCQVMTGQANSKVVNTHQIAKRIGQGIQMRWSEFNVARLKCCLVGEGRSLMMSQVAWLG